MGEQRQDSECNLICQRSLTVKMQMNQGSVLPLFLFTVVEDVVTELAKHILSVMLYADNLAWKARQLMDTGIS